MLDADSARSYHTGPSETFRGTLRSSFLISGSLPNRGCPGVFVKQVAFFQIAVCLLAVSAAPVAADVPPADAFRSELSAYFGRYCIDCHSRSDAAGGIVLDEPVAPDDLSAERKKWLRVLNMVRVGAMPPEEIEQRPSVQDSARVADLLSQALYDFDCGPHIPPGHPTIRRLNRTEYNNTVRDLFGIDLTPADDFPADDVGEGFDNMGGVLSVSALLMEKYLTAAERIVETLIDTTDYSVPRTWHFDSTVLQADAAGFEDARGLRWLTGGGELSFTLVVPVAGDYRVGFDAAARPKAETSVAGVLCVDGDPVSELELLQSELPRHYRRRIRLSGGSHRVSFRFPDNEQDSDENDQSGDPGPESGSDNQEQNTEPAAADAPAPQPGIGHISVRGPYGDIRPVRSDSHRRIVCAEPGPDCSVSEAAERIVEPLLKRVFRRPVSAEETGRYRDFIVQLHEGEQYTWEQAVAAGIQAMLVSPHFLFRVEKDPDDGQDERLLSDHELAVRLSYLLWSSMPDDELFRLADEGRLHEPQVLIPQIHRMIQDDRSQAFVDSFAAQWLNLRLLNGAQPDAETFPEFDEQLRQDMLQETTLFFRHIMLKDLSVLELLQGRFTFVNRRLAAHYGLDGVDGEQFVRVSLDQVPRRGVLTQGAILTLTSYPRRTSPVRRGKWILENLFGDAPPPPPPGVPELEQAAGNGEALSVREQMERHRTHPVCASCHQTMDPLGLGLEHFDAIGRWRDSDQGHPIDASGALPNGRTFSGTEELLEILATERRDMFLKTLAGKLLVYATGRGLIHSDECVLRDCLHHMKQNGYRFSSLVEAVVLSDPFRKRGRPEQTFPKGPSQERTARQSLLE